jgi:hypothetical protein
LPKRSRDRRTTATDIAARLDRSRPCIAQVVPDTEPGVVFMILMACPPEARCPKCTDARARQRQPKPYTPPATATTEELPGPSRTSARPSPPLAPSGST